MRILYVGDDWVGSNARSMADGFRQAGHDVIVVDTGRVSRPRRLSAPWIYAKAHRRRAPWDVETIHRKIDRLATDVKPDLLFAFKTVHLDQARLLDAPAGMHIHYSPDDVSNPYNTTADYLAHEGLWDLIVTTKRHNVRDLERRGARAVSFVLSAYDPAWHHPSARRTERQYLVGFIGTCRPDRRQETISLARRYGSQMLVRGPGWRRVPELWRTPATVGGPAYGEQFSTAVASVTANLVFLNSDNRDTHTCRTFEVPGAGGLFVGERTDEHAQLLTEGEECLLFSDRNELHSILDWCARHPAQADRMAEAGHRRITTGRHRYVDRATEIITALG